MAHHRNSASRVLDFLRSLPVHPDGTHVLTVWSQQLSLAQLKNAKQAQLVAARLGLMSRELQIVRDGMERAGFSESLYADAIGSIDSALSPLHLSGSWGQVRSLLTTEYLRALAFCAEILPDDESEISTEDLDEILALVAELEELLTESQLPESLRALIGHHVILIREAISEYPISGARRLREASRTGFAEIVEVRHDVQKHEKAKEVSKLDQVWKKFNSVADAALKADKLAQLGQKTWDLLEGLVKHAQ